MGYKFNCVNNEQNKNDWIKIALFSFLHVKVWSGRWSQRHRKHKVTQQPRLLPFWCPILHWGVALVYRVKFTHYHSVTFLPTGDEKGEVEGKWHDIEATHTSSLPPMSLWTESSHMAYFTVWEVGKWASGWAILRPTRTWGFVTKRRDTGEHLFVSNIVSFLSPLNCYMLYCSSNDIDLLIREYRTRALQITQCVLGLCVCWESVGLPFFRYPQCA